MGTSNNFSEYYKTISDTDLMNILDNPDDYQPLAVEAAKLEFSMRQLSDNEIQVARQPLIVKQEQKQKEKEKLKAVENKIKHVGISFIDTINPIQPEIHSTEKTIRLIVIVFGGIFIFQYIKDFQTHLSYVNDIPTATFESIFYLFSQLLLLVAIYTFWKRKTVGWTLLTIFLTFSAVGAAWLLYRSLTWKPYMFIALNNLFPRPSPTAHIFQLLFLIGVLYVLCKTALREVFLVDNQRMIATIAVTAVVSVGVTFIFLI